MTQVMDTWSSARPLITKKPDYIASEAEATRVAAYDLYEAIYWCVPDTFKVMARGAENKPIYVPSGRTIVETLNRFMAPKVSFIADPEFGTPNDQDLANQVMTDLARRERIYSRFAANKRYGIIRGDWMFTLWADGSKEPGSRISVLPQDPGEVFPIFQPGRDDVVIGYHIAEPIVIEDKPFIRRGTYLKQTGVSGPSPIMYDQAIFEIDKWGGPGMDPEEESVKEVLIPAFTLPAPIDQLPIYHIQNFAEPGVLWGSSEMRGLERIIQGVNQAISDEELQLALDGLGIWTTDAGTPIDADGNDVGWNLGPGRVVELPEGKTMNRLTGVASVAPSQEHLAYLHAVLDDVIGSSDVAKGRADATVAESGIALLIQLGPLLAHTEEKEEIVTDVTTNMLFDLAKWYVAYEGGAFRSLMDASRWIPKYGPKIPENRLQSITELLSIAQSTPQILPMSYVRDRLRTLGYEDMPDEATIQAEIAKETQVTQDAFGARVDGEVQAELASGNGQAPAAAPVP